MRVLLALVVLLSSAQANADERRIVTIGGAVTEIAYALGKEGNLVGSDTTSYYPKAAAKLPKVGYQRALSAEGILSLKPDLVILTTEAGPPPVLAQLKQAGTKILTLEANPTVEGVLDKVTKISKELNSEERGNKLKQSIQSDIESLKAEIAKQANTPKAMFVLQHGGGAPMVAGKDTAADGIMKLAGINNVVGEYEGYKPLTPESAVTFAPDILLVTNRGLEQAGGKEGMLKTPGLNLTPAGKSQKIIAMDSLLMLGFGPRTAEAAKQLHETAHKL